jgi:hypothetical protein
LVQVVRGYQDLTEAQAAPHPLAVMRQEMEVVVDFTFMMVLPQAAQQLEVI